MFDLNTHYVGLDDEEENPFLRPDWRLPQQPQPEVEPAENPLLTPRIASPSPQLPGSSPEPPEVLDELPKNAILDDPPEILDTLPEGAQLDAPPKPEVENADKLREDDPTNPEANPALGSVVMGRQGFSSGQAALKEFGEHAKKGFETNIEDVQAGFRQQIAEAFRGQRNPYVEKTVAEAKADVPVLEEKISGAEKRVAAVADKESVTEEEARALRLESPEIAAAHTQLEQAKRASTGDVTETFRGSLSRAAEDVAGVDREEKEAIAGKYIGKIFPENNEKFWNQVGESIGSSAPTMAASALNPVLGLALMGAQTYEQAHGEFLEKGGDPKLANEYALKQMFTQTPLEVVGEVLGARIITGVASRMLSKAGAKPLGDFLIEQAKNLGKALAGEVLVTTPGQSIIDETLAEKYGIRAPTTIGEKAAKAIEQSKVAAAQTLLMVGGPVAAGTVHQAATGGFQSKAAEPGAIPKPQPQVPSGVTEADLAAAPVVSGAPPIKPGVTIVPSAVSEVPGSPAVPPVSKSVAEVSSAMDVPGAAPASVEIAPAVSANGAAAVPGMVPAVGTVSGTPEQVSPGVRLAVIEKQLSVETDPVRRTALAAQKVVLDTEVTTSQSQDAIAQHAEKLVAAGAPETAKALQQAATEDVNAAKNEIQAKAVTELAAAQDIATARAEAMGRGAQRSLIAEQEADIVQAQTANTGVPVQPAVQGVNGQPAQGVTIVPPAVQMLPPGIQRTPGAQAVQQQPHPVVEDLAAQPAAVADTVEIFRPRASTTEAVLVRPSQQLAAHIGGLVVKVEAFVPTGERVMFEQDAAVALAEAKKDHTALSLLSDCLLGS